ncbi:MAG: GTP cyclohydrolase II [Gammaproteobacteria bacterium]|nr:GTP cyclohydrolase II [Gammaproteobacteria bacterium]
MFTYLDPSVRERLIAAGTFQRIDADGQPQSAESIGSGSISLLGPIPLPLAFAGQRYQADWYACVRNTELTRIDEIADELRAKNAQQSFASLASSMAVNSVLVIGDRDLWREPLVRVHSSCLTGDVFGSERCECGPQLQSAVQLISDEPQGGLLIYMSGHEGRGIGLWAKAATYLLQDSGENTYQANRSLGLPDDSRDFTDAATLLKFFLGDLPFRLLTNNPKKISDLTAAGLANITPVKHVFGVTDSNRRYLNAKRDWGHEIDESDIND